MTIDTEMRLLKSRRTKIVATLGPASSDAATIARLVAAGVNVFRLNFSHGTHDDHARTFARVAAATAEAGRIVGVLADLCGPKIRVGTLPDEGIELTLGEQVTITTRDVVGASGLIPSGYEALADDVTPGDRILLADGVMEVLVDAVDGPDVACTVIQGGLLTSRKGINLPGVDVSAPCLTTKDRDDARFALALGVDYLGLSFVRRAEDVAALRAIIDEAGVDAGIVAKIERPEALTNVEAIVETSDAIMVARGDLGVELPPERVPVAQRQLIDAARAHNRPVIVATQMLESMVETSRPTRAEVSDVSQAVMAGADAVMLSAETATGAHPVLAVEMMNRIARQSEAYLWEQGAFGDFSRRYAGALPMPFGDAVARSTAQLSRDLMVRAIVVVSHGGMTAVTMSSARPAAPVIALSEHASACRRMALMWGVLPERVDPATLSDPVALTRAVAAESGLAEPGDHLLLVSGFSQDTVRNTPTITLVTS